jgi:Cu+-exporting ATPase
VKGAEGRQLALPPATGFEARPGRGVTGTVEGQPVALGNERLLEELGVPLPPDLAAQAAAGREDGQTVMVAVVGRQVAGLLGVADPIKPSAPEALRSLRADGLALVMLTGDNRATAEAVAHKLGLTEVLAGVLPDEKAAAIQRLQEAGHRVAMAGDGINDAPALARADVGIAMGTGADVAMQSAAITLVKGDLGGLLRARRLGRETMRNIRQNLFLAFVYNALGIPLAAGVLYPVTGLFLHPSVAAAAMAASSVSVIANALRLRRVRI